MGKKWIGMLGLLAALTLAADTELDVNGALQTKKADAKLPDAWIYYPQYTKAKLTTALTRSDKGNTFDINVESGMLPLFCSRLFPVKPGEKLRIAYSVSGTATVQPALYMNNRRNKIKGTIYLPKIKLKETPEELALDYTVPQELPNEKGEPPAYIRFVLNVYPGTVKITRIFAVRVDGSGVLKKLPAPKTPRERLTDAIDTLDGWKAPRAKIVDADGGKAMRLPYPGVMVSKIFPYSLDDVAALKDMQGIAFDAKTEDGRVIYLPVTIGGHGNWGWNYTQYVPISGDKFSTYTLAWADFVPPRATRDMEFGKPGALTAPGVNTVAFGDQWGFGGGNAAHKAGAVLIRNLRFAPKAEAQLPAGNKGFGKLADVVKKMKSGEPVLIYLSGDSLTANGPAGKRYAEVLGDLLRKKYNNPKIRPEIIAVGGAHSWTLRVWAVRDFLNRPTPDLVTLTVGYNDRSAAMDAELFKASLHDYFDRISALTGGKAAVLLMPTMPARAERRHMQDPFADACRSLAKEMPVSLFDLHNVFAALKGADYEAKFADKCHFNEDGHAFIAAQIADYLDKQ